MSVVNTVLLWNGQTAKLSSDAPIEYSAVYRVTTNNESDGPQVVLAGFTAKRLGDHYSFGNDSDASATLKEISPRRVNGNRLLWEVVCTFKGAESEKPEEKEDSSGNPSNNPLDWRDEWELTFAQHQAPVWKAELVFPVGADGIGLGIRRPPESEVPSNSAGEPFNPGLTKDDSILVVRRTSYREKFDTQEASNWQDIVNPGPILLNLNDYNLTLRIDRRCGKIQNYGGSFNVATIPATTTTPERRVKYWKRVLEVHVRRDTWLAEVADLGRREATGATPAGAHGYDQNDFPPGTAPLESIKDPKGEPVGPLPLDGKGRLLAAGAVPFWITYKLYTEIDFTRLFTD